MSQFDDIEQLNADNEERAALKNGLERLERKQWDRIERYNKVFSDVVNKENQKIASKLTRRFLKTDGTIEEIPVLECTPPMRMRLPTYNYIDILGMRDYTRATDFFWRNAEMWKYLSIPCTKMASVVRKEIRLRNIFYTFWNIDHILERDDIVRMVD